MSSQARKHNHGGVPDTTPPQLRPEAVRHVIRSWYGALDDHAPVDVLIDHLAVTGLLLQFPTATIRTADAFREWYTGLTSTHFDQRREPLWISVRPRSPLHADVTVRLRWQARLWAPPAARSLWAGCVLTDVCTVVVRDGAARIRTMRSDAATLLPGSATMPYVVRTPPLVA